MGYNQHVVKHGMSGTKIYKTWKGMKSRCNSKIPKNSKIYGNLSVFLEWREFLPFYDWALTHGYEEHLTLDRKDNNLGYCPDNCRWITNQEQQNNKKNTIYIEIDGITDTITGWSKRTGLKRETIWDRYQNQKLIGKDVIKCI